RRRSTRRSSSPTCPMARTARCASGTPNPKAYLDVSPRIWDGRFTRSPFTPGACIMARLRRSESPDCNATVAAWVQCRRAVGDDLCMIRHPACLWEGCPPSVP
ncbi:MAG: hypothetical protein RLP09_32770, partial [Sandaracinaceae bacterium]